tara:strand:- start:154 stop:1734 length:1581 start_codon:yes stop_codon:yes gene_type:complete
MYDAGKEFLTSKLPSGSGRGPYSSSYASGQEIDTESDDLLRSRATDAPYDENTSPIGRDIRGLFRGAAGYGTIEETEKEITARQILEEQSKNLDAIQTRGDFTGALTRGVSDEELRRMTKAEKFYEGLMGEARPTGISPVKGATETDSKTISRYFANNPDAYTKLQALQEKHGDQEGLLLFAEQNMKTGDKKTEIQALEEIQQQAVTGGLPPNTYYDPVNGMIIDKATGKSIDADTTPDLDPTIHKQQIAVTGNNTPVVSNPTTITTAGGNAGLTDDVYRGQKQVLSEQMEKILNPLRNKDGQMDRKWLAIAAGAFNAAQKGAPTLMAGLADLGGGVTEQLQSLDKEDQERAIALMAIYQKQMQLDETARGHDLTYGASMNKNQLDLVKAAADRAGKTSTSVLNSTKAWDAAKKNKTLGEFGSSDFAGSVIDYSEQGVSSAQLQYNTLLSKIRVVEEEIMDDINNFDPSNAEHMKEAMKEFKEHLNDNPDQKMIYNDYWTNRGYEKEGKLVPFDMTTSLRFQPNKG